MGPAQHESTGGAMAFEADPCALRTEAGELIARGFVREHDEDSLLVDADALAGTWFEPGEMARRRGVQPRPRCPDLPGRRGVRGGQAGPAARPAPAGGPPAALGPAGADRAHGPGGGSGGCAAGAGRARRRRRPGPDGGRNDARPAVAGDGDRPVRTRPAVPGRPRRRARDAVARAPAGPGAATSSWWSRWSGRRRCAAGSRTAAGSSMPGNAITTSSSAGCWTCSARLLARRADRR